MHFLLGPINWLGLVILAISLQEALLKSNEVFETFKQDIEKVGIRTFDMFPILYFKLATQNDTFLHLVLGNENGLIIFYCSLYVDPDGKIYKGAQKGKRFLKKQVREIRCFSHRAC